MPYEGKYSKNTKRSDKRDNAPKRTGAVGQFLDNHIRLIAALGTVVVLLLAVIILESIFVGNGFNFGKDEEDGEDMTVGFIVALDEKTSPISWKDLDGKNYKTVSEDEEDDNVYVLRRYSVEGGELSVLVGGYTRGDAYTGYVEYATVSHSDDFDFSFSLIEDDGFLVYLGEFESSNKD